MTPHKFQLVLQFPGSTPEDFDDLVVLEDSLIESFRRTPHVVDGHDIGSGTMNIFIHTDDPKAAFAIATQAIYPVELPKLKAAYRSFAGDDYEWLWPQDYTEEFRLL